MFSPIAPRLKITGTVNEQLEEFFQKTELLIEDAVKLTPKV